jgi:UPF0716 protein FxsA
MLIYLILLMTAVPFVELALLLQVHHVVSEAWGTGAGLLVTLGTVIITGVIGAALARQQGVRVLKDLQASLNRGEMPGKAIADGVLVLVGAAMLLTPGFLTDLFGFSLLIPVTRVVYRELLMRWARKKLQAGEVHVSLSGGNPAGDSVKSPEARYEPNLSEEDETGARLD